MAENVLFLVASLAVILGGCEIFVNGLEWAGFKLKLNEGVVGSIFAAVGTALPETMIPLLAILFAGGESEASHVGIGAILGAPFMLATLAMFVTGVGVVAFAWQGRRNSTLNVNPDILGRDLRFFVVAFSIALAAAFVTAFEWKLLAAVAEVVLYVFYVYRHATDVHEAQEDVELDALHFARGSVNPRMRTVLLQIGFGLVLILVGAHLFVGNIVGVANGLGVPALLLSLILAPVATELPEKFNSILWVRRGKDTLALGNITGAMVFQSSVVAVVGILLTDWTISSSNAQGFASIAAAMASVFTVLVSMHLHGRLTAATLLVGGFWYVSYFGYLLVAGLL